MMIVRTATLMASVLLLVAFAPGSASAQDAKDRTVEQYLCRDIVR